MTTTMNKLSNVLADLRSHTICELKSDAKCISEVSHSQHLNLY